MPHANINNIPAEIKSLKQWVCWKYEEREDGKTTKIPYHPNGYKAESDNPKTWSTFDACLKVISHYSGIGVMFGNGLAGIDIDHCLDASGHLDERSRQIVERLNTYTEVTPSGTGLHCLFFGGLPTGGRRKGNIEIYSQGRYFTVTGNHLLGTPNKIENCEAQIAALHAEIFPNHEKIEQSGNGNGHKPLDLSDLELIEKARGAKNGYKFDMLWRGDTAGYASHSEADMALCVKLAFWTGGDLARIDRLFRQSGLMREKWDAKRGDSTYGRDTLHQAIQTQNTFYNPAPRVLAIPEPPEDPPIDLSEEPPPDLAEAPLDEVVSEIDEWGPPYTLEDAYLERPPVVYLVENIFAEETVNMIYGDSGSLKSMLMADLCTCVAAGSNWLTDINNLAGLKTCAGGAMWIDYDNGARRSHNRFGALARARNLPTTAPVFYYSMAMPQLDSADSDHIGKLYQRIVQHKIKLLVVDNLSLVSGDSDENSRDMAQVIAGFRFLAERSGICVVIIHHQNKPSTFNRKVGDLLRGHSSIKAGLDVALYVLRDGDEENRSNDIFISAPKTRDNDIAPFAARFSYTSERQNELTTARFWGIEWKDGACRSNEKLSEKIIDHLTNSQGCGKDALHDAVGGRYKQFTETLDAMVTAGKIKRQAGERNKITYTLV